jgi:hypothetical protein
VKKKSHPQLGAILYGGVARVRLAEPERRRQGVGGGAGGDAQGADHLVAAWAPGTRGGTRGELSPRILLYLSQERRDRNPERLWRGVPTQKPSVTCVSRTKPQQRSQVWGRGAAVTVKCRVHWECSKSAATCGMAPAHGAASDDRAAKARPVGTRGSDCACVLTGSVYFCLAVALQASDVLAELMAKAGGADASKRPPRGAIPALSDLFYVGQLVRATIIGLQEVRCQTDSPARQIDPFLRRPAGQHDHRRLAGGAAPVEQIAQADK